MDAAKWETYIDHVLEKTSGHDRLDASALRAVMEWKFNSEGIIRVRIPFTFRIRG